MPDQDHLKQIDKWKQQGETIVLATGIFDLLHIEHLRFLTRAKAAGDKLIVGIETDVRVKQIKGENRPINNQQVRLEQLNSLKSVDLAFILPDKFHTQADWEKLVQDIKPDIYAVSSHTSYLANKKRVAEKCGCQFRVVHQHNPQYSTSKILHPLLKEL